MARPANPDTANRRKAIDPTDPDNYKGLSDDGANDFVSDLLNQAADLRAERYDVLARQTANREVLRNVKVTGKLSEAQAKAVDLFYPPREASPAESNGDTGEVPQAPAKAAQDTDKATAK